MKNDDSLYDHYSHALHYLIKQRVFQLHFQVSLAPLALQVTKSAGHLPPTQLHSGLRSPPKACVTSASAQLAFPR